jgi:acyl-CoA synthetase (AMP-forming)/AMP-acid ligase II
MDLTFAITESHTGLTGQIEYNIDLFDEGRIDRMAQHFITILRSAAANPRKRISELEMLTEAERTQMLVDWNKTDIVIPPSRSVQELFESRARKYPGAVAVEFNGRHLTYSQLNRRANDLANLLRTLGVGPEVIVAVFLPPSSDSIIAVLAILKAGGAFLLLNPLANKKRLVSIVEKTQPSVLLTWQELIEDLPDSDLSIIVLDEKLLSRTTPSGGDLQAGTTLENLACLLFDPWKDETPLGVQILHKGLLNLALWFRQRDRLAARDYLIEISLDDPGSSLWVLLPLLVPGKVSHFTASDSLQRRAVPAKPSWFRLLTASKKAQTRRPSSLPIEVANNLTVNEATQVAFCGIVSRGSRNRAWHIQREPVSNASVYLLDNYMNPVPVGVTGEMYIGGAGTARGYLREPGRTAERFIPHPFTDEPGARLFKSGELARYLSDGSIEYQGLKSNQVKVRGYEFNLHVIEQALQEHPSVWHVVALVCDGEGPACEKRIIACVIPRQEEAPVADELHAFLKDRLPQCMLPSDYMMLEGTPSSAFGMSELRALFDSEGGVGTQAAVSGQPRAIQFLPRMGNPMK